MTYAAVYLLLLLAAGISSGDPARRRAFYVLAIIVLVIFVGFRHQVGCDWFGYLNIYEIQRTRSIETVFQQREPLFALINRLLHAYEIDYPYINVIASLVFFAGFHLLARRQPDPLGTLILSFPLLIMHIVMSGIRQAMAIGILCVAFNAFNDRRPLLYVGLVMLAGGFHTSALIFLSLAPFVMGELSRRNLALGAAVGLPGLYYLASGEQFTIYYDRYVDTGNDAAGAPIRTGFLTMTGMLFLLVMKNRWRRLYPVDYKLNWVSATIMLALFPLVFVSSVIADRVAYYLMPAQIVILARFPFVNRGVFSPLILSLPFVAGGIVLFGWMALSAHFAQCYVPYSSWLLI